MPLSLLSVPGTPGAIGWRPGSVAAPGRAEQAGDLGDGLVAGLDVAHDGARGLVPGLGHDQLQRDLLVTEVGRCGVTELVELQAAAGGGGGVFLEQDPGAVVAQAAPAGVRADVTGAGRRAGAGLRLARNSGPLVRLVPSGRRSSRGSRCAVPVSQ